MTFTSYSRLIATGALIVTGALFPATRAIAQQNEPESLTNGRIAWSPDGGRLAFSANWGGDDEIYVVDIDGANMQQLTNNEREDQEAIFTHDGTSIIYATRVQRDEETNDLDIYIVGIEGGEPHHYYGRAGRSEMWPQLMASGRFSVIAVTSPGVIDILAVNISSGAEEPIISSEGRDGWGVFSRDGRRLVYTSNRLGGGAKFDIFLSDASGANDRHLNLYPLSVNGYGSVLPDFFPDSRRFIYWSDKDGFEPGDNYHYVYDLRRNSEERLPRPDGAVIGIPSVSPDGNTIAFSADYNSDGARVISLMDVRTRQVLYLNIAPPGN